MILGFDVDGQFVTRRDDERVVNRSVNYLELCFNFKDSETWDDLIKRVLFKGNGETYSKQLDNENKVVVPSEVLTGDSFVFTLYGITDDDPVVRVTCNLMKITMVSSGFTGDSLVPGPGNRSVVDDVYARLDGLDVTVGEHSVSLSTLSDDVTGLTGSVSALSTNVNTIGDDVTSLENIVTGHTRSLDGLARDVDSIGDTVDSLETVVNGHTNSIDGLDSLVNDLDTVVGKHDKGINDLSKDVGDLEQDYNQKINNTVEMTVEYTDGTTETFDVVVK